MPFPPPRMRPPLTIDKMKGVNTMDNRPIRQDRMDHIEKGARIGKPRGHEYYKKAMKNKDRKDAKKREKEKEMDKWFESLTVSQQADVAYNFWDGASYEEKKEEYELE